MTDTDCDLWDDLLASPRSFADLDGAQLDALASHVDACSRCRERAAAAPPQVDLFALLARDATGHAHDADFARDVDDLIDAQQRDIILAVTDVLYPAFRNTSGAAQLEEVRAALARHPDPALAHWRAIDAVALLVRRLVHQEQPSRQWLRDDGAIDLGDGNEIPVTTLAAEMARSAGIDRDTARRVVAWLPDAVRRVPTLFRGLEAAPTTTEDGHPAMALKLVQRDNQEPLAVRWQPPRPPQRRPRIDALLDALWRRVSKLAAAQGYASEPARAALENLRTARPINLAEIEPLRTFVGQVVDRTDDAADRRALLQQMEACTAALEDAVRVLSMEEERRHEQSGDW